MTLVQEKKRYALHDNTAQNHEYVNYLSSIVNDLMRHAPTCASALDFGCGCNHVLADILCARGICCNMHDPLYGMVVDKSKKYDCVIACEVMEHLRDPRSEIRLIGNLVAPDGIVYIRTGLYDEKTDFSSWYYAADPTHIGFYCVKTMEAVAEMMGMRVEFANNKDTVIIKN